MLNPLPGSPGQAHTTVHHPAFQKDRRGVFAVTLACQLRGLLAADEPLAVVILKVGPESAVLLIRDPLVAVFSEQPVDLRFILVGQRPRLGQIGTVGDQQAIPNVDSQFLEIA